MGKESTGNGIPFVTELPKRLAPVVGTHRPTVVCRKLGDRQKTGIQDGYLQSCVLSPLMAAAIRRFRGDGKMWEKRALGEHTKVWVKIIKSDMASQQKDSEMTGQLSMVALLGASRQFSLTTLTCAQGRVTSKLGIQGFLHQRCHLFEVKSRRRAVTDNSGVSGSEACLSPVLAPLPAG